MKGGHASEGWVGGGKKGGPSLSGQKGGNLWSNQKKGESLIVPAKRRKSQKAGVGF